jgi:hypothetical protein
MPAYGEIFYLSTAEVYVEAYIFGCIIKSFESGILMLTKCSDPPLQKYVQINQ